MTCSVSTLVSDIRVALDQNMSSTALSTLGDVDTLSLEEIINSKIEDAAEAVALKAPLAMLSDVSEDITATSTLMQQNTRYVTTLGLPSDFLRLVRFRLNSWSRAVNEAYGIDSPLYAQARSPYGIRGTVERPLVFIIPSSLAGQKILEAYCGVSGDTIVDKLYVKKPTINNSNIVLASLLKRPTVYYAAYLVALTLQDKDAAERLLGVCMTLLE